MSTSPYSIYLREKVIKYLEAGNSQRSASRVFQLSPTTVNTWHVRYKKEGHYQARKYKGAKPIVNSGEVGDVVTSRRLPTITKVILYFTLFGCKK